MTTTPTFITKLRSLVDDPLTNNVISWDKKGTSFHVYDITTLSRVYLPNYFKHNNYSSFVRQLNMYGFRKVNRYDSAASNGFNTSDVDDMQFQHPFFLQESPELMSKIQRRQTNAANSNNVSNNSTNHGFRHVGNSVPSSQSTTTFRPVKFEALNNSNIIIDSTSSTNNGCNSNNLSNSSTSPNSTVTATGGGGGNSTSINSSHEQLDLILKSGVSSSDPFVFPQLYEVLLQMNDRLMSTEKRVVQLESNRSQMRTEIVGLRHRLNLHIGFTKNLVNMLLSSNPNLSRFGKRHYPSLMAATTSTSSNSSTERGTYDADLLDEIHHRPFDCDHHDHLHHHHHHHEKSILSPSKKNTYSSRPTFHINGNFTSVDCNRSSSRMLALPFKWITTTANNNNNNISSSSSSPSNCNVISQDSLTTVTSSSPSTSVTVVPMSVSSTNNNNNNNSKRVCDPLENNEFPTNYKRMKTAPSTATTTTMDNNNSFSLFSTSEYSTPSPPPPPPPQASHQVNGKNNGNFIDYELLPFVDSGNEDEQPQPAQPTRHPSFSSINITDLIGSEDKNEDILVEKNDFFNELDCLLNDKDTMALENLLSDSSALSTSESGTLDYSQLLADFHMEDSLRLWNGQQQQQNNSSTNRNEIIGNEIIPFDGMLTSPSSSSPSYFNSHPPPLYHHYNNNHLHNHHHHPPANNSNSSRLFGHDGNNGTQNKNPIIYLSKSVENGGAGGAGGGNINKSSAIAAGVQRIKLIPTNSRQNYPPTFETSASGGLKKPKILLIQPSNNGNNQIQGNKVAPSTLFTSTISGKHNYFSTLPSSSSSSNVFLVKNEKNLFESSTSRTTPTPTTMTNDLDDSEMLMSNSSPPPLDDSASSPSFSPANNKCWSPFYESA